MTLAPPLALADYQGSQAEQDACTPDVLRLCQAYIPDEAPIVACLQSNQARLSPACFKVIFPEGSVAQPTRTSRKQRRRAPQD